jgi:transposase-like protein
MEELTYGTSGSRRRYDKDEVQEIVKRATEMEATNKTASGAMTIGGVQALAGEVGVAPDLVRAAAESLRAAAESLQTPHGAPGALAPNRTNPWVAGPTELFFERVIDGELPESEYATVVDEIRRVLRNAGQVSQFGRSFSWIAARGPAIRRDLEVAVSVRRGQTRITIQENMNQLIGAVYGGIGGGMGGGGMGPILGIGAGALHLGAAAVAIVPIWLGITYLTARTVYRRSTGRRHRELAALINRLATLVEELVVTPHRLQP